MSKLSEPVAKALETLLERCIGDTKVLMRTITGNYNAYEYFYDLQDEIKLIRCANFDDILIALVEGLPQAIKTTEQPSVAAAVEGILTEEELKERNRLLVLENDELNTEIMMRIRYEGFLRSVIRCKGTLEDNEGYDWFKQRHSEIMKSLEESK